MRKRNLPGRDKDPLNVREDYNSRRPKERREVADFCTRGFRRLSEHLVRKDFAKLFLPTIPWTMVKPWGRALKREGSRQS